MNLISYKIHVIEKWKINKFRNIFQKHNNHSNLRLQYYKVKKSYAELITIKCRNTKQLTAVWNSKRGKENGFQFQQQSQETR